MFMSGWAGSGGGGENVEGIGGGKSPFWSPSSEDLMVEFDPYRLGCDEAKLEEPNDVVLPFTYPREWSAEVMLFRSKGFRAVSVASIPHVSLSRQVPGYQADRRIGGLWKIYLFRVMAGSIVCV